MPSCSSVGYGSCVVSGSALAGACPYSYVVEHLEPDVNVFLRVAAQNDVPVQALAAGASADNRKWSGTLTARPQDMPPQAPRAVDLFTLDGSTIQVHVLPPGRSGGLNVASYVFMLDTDATYSSPGECLKS